MPGLRRIERKAVRSKACSGKPETMGDAIDADDRSPDPPFELFIKFSSQANAGDGLNSNG